MGRYDRGEGASHWGLFGGRQGGFGRCVLDGDVSDLDKCISSGRIGGMGNGSVVNAVQLCYCPTVAFKMSEPWSWRILQVV